MDVDSEKLRAIINKYEGSKSHLLAMFQDIQREYRYVPREAVAFVSGELGIPLAKAYEVVTFYKALSLTPRGRHTVHVCLGTACHLRGGPNVLEAFERELKVKVGGTSEDGLFTLETVNCLGACALAPLVRVEERDFGKTTPGGVKKIISEFGTGEQS
jgi:NADH:ubiquinone oxidoreductase subunit E